MPAYDNIMSTVFMMKTVYINYLSTMQEQSEVGELW